MEVEVGCGSGNVDYLKPTRNLVRICKNLWFFQTKIDTSCSTVAFKSQKRGAIPLFPVCHSSPLPRLANSPLSRLVNLLVNLLVNSSLPEPVNLASPSEDFFARIPSPVLTQSLNLQKMLGKSWMEEMFSFHSAHLLRTRLNCRNSLRAVLSLLSKDPKRAQMEPIFTNMLKTRLSWGCRNYIILFGDLPCFNIFPVNPFLLSQLNCIYCGWKTDPSDVAWIELWSEYDLEYVKYPSPLLSLKSATTNQ